MYSFLCNSCVALKSPTNFILSFNEIFDGHGKTWQFTRFFDDACHFGAEGQGREGLNHPSNQVRHSTIFSRCLSFFLSTCRRSSDVIHINAPFNVFQAVDRPGLPLPPKARTFPASGLQGLKSPEKDREFREERGG